MEATSHMNRSNHNTVPQSDKSQPADPAPVPKVRPAATKPQHDPTFIEAHLWLARLCIVASKRAEDERLRAERDGKAGAK
jgi:hypothetical protein